LQLAGSHVLASLLAFNVGVELGQILVLVALVPMLHFAFTRVVAERVGIVILSAIVAHTGWHWMVDRGSALMQYTFVWPAIDAAFLAGVLRLAMVFVIALFAAWLLSLFTRGEARRARSPYPPAAAPRSGAGDHHQDGEMPTATHGAPAAETRSL
jgi:hypothetical protein